MNTLFLNFEEMSIPPKQPIHIMLDVKYNIKGLVSSIYECQKKIILNRRFIREMEAEGQDTSQLEEENRLLDGKIRDYQKELRKKYQFSY